MDAHTAARGWLISTRHLPALFAYAAITVALTWPLVLSPGGLVPKDLGDPLLTTVILWWNAHQLPFTDAWWNGSFFFPGADSLALSDHRVGLSVIATPLIRLGASPLFAYGITFLSTWWLSAVAAYALVWILTANRAAAFIGGLIFGFNPFRAGHLAHLELLASYWLPVILIALHQWLATRRRVWLMALSAALLLQALTSGYYFVFMGVFVVLWLFWFARGLANREYAALGLALLAPIAVMSPVLLHYRHVHDAMGLSRSIEDIRRFSADLAGLLTAPEPIALWGAPAAWQRPEGELMPGLVAVVLVIIAAVIGRGQRPTARVPVVVTWLRRLLLAVAVTEIVVAALPWFVGPVAFTLAGIAVSMSGMDKPLSVAFVCLAAWILTSRSSVAALTSRSKFAFYGLAAAVMYVLALGPEGRLLGRPVIYKAPYAWLMVLPGFDDSFRAPARFAMLAALALGVAAALAFVRLTTRVSPGARALVTTAIVAAIIAESWIYPFPLTPAPPPFALPPDLPASAVVLELPMGIYEDALAMFHTTMHRRPTVNGLSGYEPPHYQILRQALIEGEDDILTAVRRRADLVVVRHHQHHDATVSWLERQTAHTHVTSPDGPHAVRPATITTDPAMASPQLLSDSDHRTAWLTRTPQKGTEAITLTLSGAQPVTGIELTLGPHVGAFARELVVEVSSGGRHWRTAAAVDGATAAFEAALRDPKVIPVTIQFEPQMASHIRIRQTGRSNADWAVAELRVLAPTNNK